MRGLGAKYQATLTPAPQARDPLPKICWGRQGSTACDDTIKAANRVYSLYLDLFGEFLNLLVSGPTLFERNSQWRKRLN